MDGFIGPCVHGRDPYTRCDECDEAGPEVAEILALRAENKRFRALVGRLYDVLKRGADGGNVDPCRDFDQELMLLMVAAAKELGR